MTTKALITLLVLVSVMVVEAASGGTLSVRLVRATNDGGARVDSRLQGVAPALERSLVYKGYAVQNSTMMSLPADGKPRALGPYVIVCSGTKDQLAISVQQNGRPLLRTTAVLRDGKPLILGGLPSDNGVLMLMFESR